MEGGKKLVDWLNGLIGQAPSQDVECIYYIVGSIIILYMVRYVLMLFGYALKFIKEFKI